MLGLSTTRPALSVHSESPFNAEPALGRLRGAFLTDAADVHVRSHGDIPSIETGTHVVRVTGLLRNALTLSLADLKSRFSATSVTAVLQCAGTRRADLQQIRPTAGDPLAPGVIGNAEWSGVSLAHVLRAAGVAKDKPHHVAFESLDIADKDGAERRALR